MDSFKTMSWLHLWEMMPWVRECGHSITALPNWADANYKQRKLTHTARRSSVQGVSDIKYLTLQQGSAVHAVLHTYTQSYIMRYSEITDSLFAEP